MNARKLVYTHTNANGKKFEVYFDQASGTGGIVKGGMDGAGFIVESGRVVDYDGVYQLGPDSLAALNGAGFNTKDVE